MTAAAGNNEISSCATRVTEHRGRENNEVTVASSIVAELDDLDEITTAISCMPSVFVRRRDAGAGRPISSLVQESCSIALGSKDRTVDRARESINILCSRYNIVKQSSNNRQTILSISCFLSRFTHVKR